LQNGVKIEKTDPTLRILFIGNSATYVNDIPGTLVKLARAAGYPIEADSVVKGGATLSFHADASTEHGQRLLQTIENKYDLVFIQDIGNCISCEEARLESQNACETLGKAIAASGARIGIYFRPPFGYEKWGLDPFEQCKRYDEHFLSVSKTLTALNAYVNRAFAYAIQDTDFNLWGEDHAHTSRYGAYLAVCVFFVTVFNVSSKILDANGLPQEDARTLQEIADKVALNLENPW